MHSMRRLLHRNLGAVAGLTRDMAGSALSLCTIVSVDFPLNEESINKKELL